MNINQFVKAYKKYLKDNYNPERAKKEKAYLYSDLKHYGLPHGISKKFIKDYKNEIKSLGKSEKLRLVRDLWKQPSHEEKSMAHKVLNICVDELTTSDMPLIEKLMRESRGWALLDNLIIPVMPVVLKKDRKSYKYLRKWIKDDDFWVRRSALLSQLLFFRRGNGGDKELFFKMAESQFDESWINIVYKDTQTRKRARFFVRKAIGWVLREMSQTDPKSVMDFVKKYKENMSGLTLREATRNL